MCPQRIQDRGARRWNTRLSAEPLEAKLALDAPQFANGEVVGTVESSALVEASGLVASRRNDGVLWTHNDNGDDRLFALNDRGEHLGIYDTGMAARDWEDISIGPGPVTGMDYLYIADTGDNSQVRETVTIFRVPEPTVNSEQSPVTQTLSGVATLTFAYPDRAHDAETLIVDPATGDLYIITKRDTRSLIFRASYPQATSGVTTLTRVGELTWSGAVGGDISPDGDEILIKDIDDVFYYPRPSGTSIAAALSGTPASVPYITQTLGEGVTFDLAGSGYFTNSEGRNEPLYYYERMAAMPGDVNGDGAVSRADLNLLVRHWGMNGMDRADGDVNADGVVDMHDLAMLQMHFGAASSGSALQVAATAESPVNANGTLKVFARRGPELTADAAVDAAIGATFGKDTTILATGRVALASALPRRR